MSAGDRTKRIAIGVAVAVGVVIVALVILVAGAGSFSELVGITREAEEAGVWRTYFTAEDCLIEALNEDPEAVVGAIDRLKAETTALASHIDESLIAFESFGTRPWQGSLRGARQAIVDHYAVWETHLAAVGPVLDGINSEPSSLSEGISQWIELAQAAVEPITSTFEEAGAAFEEAAAAARDDDLIVSLFVPAEVNCSRTAV